LTWLNDAVLYEIYPQSFADSNADGIGDLVGVLEHLDHLEWLGVNTIWFNPCFASPFRDAGYDVSDYLQIAPRYGTNEDMARLVEAAGERGMRVMLDLVAGHTSVQHAWFQRAANDGSDDRYIWAERPGEGFVRSPGSRRGYYLRNFFDEQPALNFGYARMDPGEPWRQPVDAPGPQRNRAALREVIAFWLDRGVAGFRVDMAYSLVKDDPGLSATTALWREIREWLDTPTRTPSCSRRAIIPRHGRTSACKLDSTATSSSSSTRRTARCSTTAVPDRCSGCPTTSTASSTPTGPTARARSAPSWRSGTSTRRRAAATARSSSPRPTTTTRAWPPATGPSSNSAPPSSSS
jgi:hypothetical protein